MRMILMAAALAGCGGGIATPEDPHTVGPCGASWGSAGDPRTPTDCEVACAEMPTSTGPRCSSVLVDGAAAICGMTFEYADGITGCCGSSNGGFGGGREIFARCK